MNDARLSYMRYHKVNAVMVADPALKRLLSKPNQVIIKQDQTSEEFSKEVVEVTTAIHNAGLDAYAMHQHQILHFATNMLVLKQPPPVAARPAKAPVAPEKPKAKAPKAPKAPKAAVKAPAVKAPVVKAAPAARTKRKSRTKLEPAKAKVAEPPSEPPEPLAEPPPVPKAETRPKDNGGPPPVVYFRKNVPLIPGITIMNDLYGAVTILEPYAAHDPEAKEIMDKLNVIIDDVHRKTVLPESA